MSAFATLSQTDTTFKNAYLRLPSINSYENHSCWILLVDLFSSYWVIPESTANSAVSCKSWGTEWWQQWPRLRKLSAAAGVRFQFLDVSAIQRAAWCAVSLLSGPIGSSSIWTVLHIAARHLAAQALTRHQHRSSPQTSNYRRDYYMKYRRRKQKSRLIR